MQDRRCPSCDSDQPLFYGSYRDEEYFTSEERFTYWKCDQCRTVFLHPLPVDKLATIYPANYYSFQDARRTPIGAIKEWLDKRYFRGILRDLTARELSVLDVGGGAGRTLDLIRSLDKRVGFTQVVDLDSTAGERARAAGHTYVCERIENFATERRFDLIVMLNLIEHVEAPGAVLKRAAELLAPGGVLLIKTPNVDAMDARLFRATYWAGLHVPRHWALFTRESFVRLLPEADLEVQQFGFTQGAPFWAASMLAALGRRGLVSISQSRPAVYHPLFNLLAAVSAAFDFARAPFARTSQMQLLLKRRTQRNG
jgi:2-polyprenyl-3-methyl-5-hydroxy-6-metoxy-1,4-benzoquinol methylase